MVPSNDLLASNWTFGSAGFLGKRITSETVEKGTKEILGGDAEKNDFTECATINDLIITKGHETPKDRALTILKGFSTVSPEMLILHFCSIVQDFKCKSITFVLIYTHAFL
jgi:hypothetical protein